MSRIDDVVNEEWDQFQMVNNVGGRASCQDNRYEFEIMRRSHFLAWKDEIVESYYEDLIKAKQEGRNLVFEKYAFMMEETAPQEYEEIKGSLPPVSLEKQIQINTLIFVQTKWAKEFEKNYPAYAGKGRPVYRTEAVPGETSIETYLRGELSSYGDHTLQLCMKFIEECTETGNNLISITRENMAKMYGYTSLEDVEKKLADQQ